MDTGDYSEIKRRCEAHEEKLKNLALDLRLKDADLEKHCIIGCSFSHGERSSYRYVLGIIESHLERMKS